MATKKLSAILAVAGIASLAASASPAAGSVKFFQSPDKNIGCAIVKVGGGGYKSNSSQARCDIKKHSWNAPPKPNSCHFDWGFGLVVGTHGKGDYVCGSDTVLGQGPVLSQGDQVDFGGFKCGIQAGKSVRCHDKSTGHGFSLSKKHKDLF